MKIEKKIQKRRQTCQKFINVKIDQKRHKDG